MRQVISEEAVGKYVSGKVHIVRMPGKANDFYKDSIQIHQDCAEGCDHTLNITIEQARKLIELLEKMV